MRIVCATIVLALSLLAPRSAAAASYTLDLSRPSGTALTVTAPPGEVVTFQVVNKLPAVAYTIVVEERVIVIPVFQAPSPLLGGFADDACAPILKLAESLGTVKDESAIGTANRQIAEALGKGDCTTPAVLAKINEWVVATTHAVPGVFTVREGVEIVLTVTRADRVWSLTVSGGPRGVWHTSYGVVVVPNDDENYFSKSIGDNKYRVTRENDVDGMRLVPSAFFTWLPRSQYLNNLSIGPTAGLGLTKDKAALFGGVGVTYNWNLAFIAGIAVSPHNRLQGRYKEGDELTENISDEQLRRQVFRPTLMAAVTFRFGSNPFAAGGTAEQSGTAKPATATKP